jgi:hypothetical protein
MEIEINKYFVERVKIFAIIYLRRLGKRENEKR